MTRRLLVIAGAAVGLVALAVVAAVVITLLRSDDPDLATEAPAIPTISAASPTSAPATGSTPAAAPTQPPSGSDAPNGVLHFVIDSAQSSAKYVVQETLRGLETTAVGETNAITGDIYLTTEGLAASPKSSFKVDLTKLQSDESLRDRFIRDNTLQTSQFPIAEFVIDSVTGFPANYVDGQEVSLTLTGTFTVHGVSKPLTWRVLARQSGDFLTATADADFKMTDFGMTPPNVQIARAKDEVHVQVVFVAKKAA